MAAWNPVKSLQKNAFHWNFRKLLRECTSQGVIFVFVPFLPDTLFSLVLASYVLCVPLPLTIFNLLTLFTCSILLFLFFFPFFTSSSTTSFISFSWVIRLLMAVHNHPVCFIELESKLVATPNSCRIQWKKILCLMELISLLNACRKNAADSFYSNMNRRSKSFMELTPNWIPECYPQTTPNFSKSSFYQTFKHQNLVNKFLSFSISYRWSQPKTTKTKTTTTTQK